jgi:FkbM family methyltransferase
MKIRPASRLRKQIGLLKSVAIYYWKPFNRRRLKKFYAQFIHAGDLCFDIGAHVGNRTRAWRDLDARVIAVEPQPECVRYLRRRFGNDPEVEIVAEAVGSMSGQATMHVSSANPTISTLAGKQWREQLNRDANYPVVWDDEVTVSVTTLDELIRRFGMPVFCKLDVENAEYDALLGLSQPLSQLSFEFYPPVMEKTFHCLDRLDALGEYEYNWSFGESLQLQRSSWLPGREIRDILRDFTTRWQYGDIYARRRH